MKSIINYIKRFILPKPKIVNADFKYQLGQEVYFITSNAVTKGKVVECRIGLINDNVEIVYGIMYKSKSMYNKNGMSILSLPELMIHFSKEDLADSLIKHIDQA